MSDEQKSDLKLTYRDFLIQQAVTTIALLAEGIDRAMSMSFDVYAVAYLEGKIEAAHVLLDMNPNPELVEGRPERGE